ncbi:MAG: flotillin-like protein FloA [Gemmatimonadetes bacterium]|nr:flotillin-like protein FloA [Gemmatimonadota bacterium]MBI2614444.1 flotillin-like protein FloA [Gemmatimonadota bacterium]
MRDLFELAPWLLPILFILGAIVLIGIASFVPVRLWIEAWAAGVSVGLTTLVGMRLRKVSPAAVIRPLINATKAGLTLGTDGLEAHYLAGGNVDRVVKALISADKAGIDLTFQRAAAIDLAGRDVLEAVQVSVNPKVIQTPKVAAMAKDGIQLIALARVTVRANIHRLVGGAGEETILARVGEGIVSTIGSSASHKAVLENPDNISKTVLAKGLDSGTAFEILSIDIADVDVGKNIGAELQTDQAEADKRIAQAKAEERRAMAVALEQEMKARTQEMRAKVVEAEAQVPLAMADAFRQGHMGVMDYVRYRNIESDTDMRRSIARGEEPAEGQSR